MNKNDKTNYETPNAETIEAIKEVEAMKKDPSIGKTYKSVDDMFDDLILEDLINSGFEGEELLNEFKEIKKSMPMADVYKRQASNDDLGAFKGAFSALLGKEVKRAVKISVEEL